MTIRLHQEPAEWKTVIPTLLVGDGQPARLLEKELRDDGRLQLRSVTSLTVVLSQTAPSATTYMSATSETVNDEPELILLLQSWSDQYSAGQVNELLGRFPLSRVLVIYGPLCASDGRTRELWPLAVRVSDWKFAERLEQEIAILRESAAALPLTASREELVEFEFNRSPDSPKKDLQQPRLVGVASADYFWRQTMRDWLAIEWGNSGKSQESVAVFVEAATWPDFLQQWQCTQPDTSWIIDQEAFGVSGDQWLDEITKNSPSGPVVLTCSFRAGTRGQPVCEKQGLFWRDKCDFWGIKRALEEGVAFCAQAPRGEQ